MPTTTYECDGCGACCRTFPIFASDDDALGEPRIAAEGRRLPEQFAAGTWHYRLFPLPFLDACAFLGEGDRCTIYQTRPQTCRTFAAGGEQCQQARQRQGLPLLGPTQPQVRPSSGGAA
jgi:Fe-S-cluster containining protein